MSIFNIHSLQQVFQGLLIFGHRNISTYALEQNSPFHIEKKLIVEKNVAKENLIDRFGHDGECYLKEFYLQMSRSKNINSKKFSILNYDVYLTPDEICEPSVEISNYLTMNSDAY